MQFNLDCRPFRFGDVFGSAHAGMTAEGDNSVLMQKVAKEHLALFKPHKLEQVAALDLENVDHLLHLFKLRENEMYSYLRNKIGKAAVFTKVTFGLNGRFFNTFFHRHSSLQIQKSLPSVLDGLAKPLQERGVFNIWMFEEQDQIQVNFLVFRNISTAYIISTILFLFFLLGLRQVLRRPPDCRRVLLRAKGRRRQGHVA